MPANNTTEAFCTVQANTSTNSILKALAYSAVILLSFFGNVMIVLVVHRNHRMRSITNYLIINMALADLATTFINMIPTLYWIVRAVDVWHVGGVLGDLFCKFLNFIQSVTVGVSVFTLVAIAVDRFFAIFWPLKRIITFRVAKGVIAGVWVSSFLISGPLLLVLSLEKGECIETWDPLFDTQIASRDYTIALFIVFYALPLCITACLYSLIMTKLWRRRTPGQETINNQEHKEKINRKVLRMLVTVVVIFTLCWLPLYVRMFVLYSVDPERFRCGLPYEMDFIPLFLGHANSAINPYLYVIFNENYRRGFATAFSRRNRKRQSGFISTTRRTKSSRMQERDTILSRTDDENPTSLSRGPKRSQTRQALIMEADL